MWDIMPVTVVTRRLHRVCKALRQSSTTVCNPLQSAGSATSNNVKLVHWPLMGGLLHLVQQGGYWAGPQPTHQLPVYESPYCCTRYEYVAVQL